MAGGITIMGGYITRPVLRLTTSANQGERASVLPLRLGVWDLGCEHQRMALGACGCPGDFDIGLTGCAGPARTPTHMNDFPVERK